MVARGGVRQRRHHLIAGVPFRSRHASLTKIRIGARTFGAQALEPLRPVMGGEDFSAYQQRAPGVFAFVGAGNVERGITAAHHHPRFDIDEASLDVGLGYLVAATVELLGG